MGRWMLPKITDYWDERVHAIDTAAAELLELDDPERDRAVSEISEAVRELGSYLHATAGTFLALMKDRGYRCQCLVDNAWEDMTRPLRLFPSW